MYDGKHDINDLLQKNIPIISGAANETVIEVNEVIKLLDVTYKECE